MGSVENRLKNAINELEFVHMTLTTKVDRTEMLLATVITNLRNTPSKVAEILAWYDEQVRS